MIEDVDAGGTEGERRFTPEEWSEASRKIHAAFKPWGTCVRRPTEKDETNED